MVATASLQPKCRSEIGPGRATVPKVPGTPQSSCRPFSELPHAGTKTQSRCHDSAGPLSALPSPRRNLWRNHVKRLRALMLPVFAAGAFAAASVSAASALDISGAGATFPYPIYAKWADAYKKETGVGLNYQSIGSGGGIKQIENKTVTFGASDMPLKPDQLNKDGLIQFPTVFGRDVPVVDVEGIKPGD